ncbi:LysR family transcriptional regulator [Salinisphaera sp. Q1T1-3]|uniref:LysR family transcriptional regulator n=1 Tax=Salinisphaera sp. Q1T1-3 TaxID=2321229 RepID=UPI000E74A6FD|nr:LysR family transcriptional regulator [Salinisphaera sp. Q1T1-3]RJS91512.1 LysR family transcriptional regulator [Salinisphaera sp. Q1T1-3]
MDLNHLKTFVEVARHGTISGAARDLGIPSSTISRRLNRLEADLETRLVLRNSRHCSLTASGQLLHDHAAALIDELLESKSIVHESRGRLSGRIRVSIPTEFGVAWLSDVIADFAAAHPDIDLACITSLPSLDPVRREIDVSIAYSRGMPQDSGLVMQRLLMLPSAVVAAPDLIAARGRPTRVAELRSLPCISTLSALQANPWQFMGDDGQCFAIEVAAGYKVDSSRLLIGGALRGIGYAVIPKAFIANELQSGALVELALDARPAPLEIVAVLPGRKYVPARIKALVEAIGSALQARGIEPI